MGEVPSIARGLPFCSSNQGHQTKVSIGLRITAVAIGTIAVLIGILIFSGIPGLSHLGSSVAWSTLSVGICLVMLGTALKCVKKQTGSGNSYMDLPAVKVEARVKNGQGEFVVFSKSGQAISPERYTSAYKIFDKFSIANILKDNASVETAMKSFEKREESIEQELQKLDPDLSSIFIPRTLYELVFIHACIEEDITAGKICSFLDPDTQKIILGHKDADLEMEESEKQKYVSNLRSKQADKKCWHLCYFDNEGDSLHPNVIKVAYRLNQLIINKIQNLQTVNFSDITDLLNSEIKFLEKYHKDCSVLADKIENGEKATSISSCAIPGPTTNFGYESMRGSIKSMGIRNKKDAKILRNAVAMECSEVALKNIFLFRGSHFKKDKPYCSDKKQDPYSLSFGTSLFSGVVYDGGATAFHYMRRDDYEAFAVMVPINELARAPFFVPLASTVCQLFGQGEIFHGRSKVWEGITQKPRGLQQGESRWEHLKTTMPREKLVSEVQRFYKQNVISMK
jgi:hypothetical protein